MIYLKNTKEMQTVYIPRTELYTEQYVNPVKTYEEGFEEGYDSGIVKGIEEQKSKLETIVINDNGTYEREDGYNKVIVEVPDVNGSYDVGYADGKNDGYNEGKEDGYNDGYDEGYDVGYTDGGDNQKSKLESITITENGSYSREDGYSNIEVNVPDLNGSYDEGFEQGQIEGYNKGKNDGIEEGYVQGKDDGIDEQKSKLERIRITENRTYSRDDGYNEIDVDVKVKTKLPNGISFAESTFTDFPVDDYDWSKMYGTPMMFRNCSNLNTEPIIEKLKDGTIPSLYTTEMFEGCKVNRIENMDFNKYFDSTRMFKNVTGLEEVKNCVFPDMDKNTKYIDFLTCSNYFRLVDCDFTRVDEYHFNNIKTWYFGKFQNADMFTTLPTSTGMYGRIYVMECDKPSTLDLTKSFHTYVWYDKTKYPSWDGYSNTHEYGFYYNVISQNNLPVDITIRQGENNTTFNFEQVIPYNNEKECYYIDYPYYMEFDVYLNGERIEVLKDKFNTNIYIPSTDKGVYEGSDIQYLLYYFLSDYYLLKPEGLFVTEKNNLESQKIITPTDSIKVTVTAGRNFLYVTKNGVSKSYSLNNSNETEHIIDTSDCDFVGLALYIIDINNTYIKKIEIL